MAFLFVITLPAILFTYSRGAVVGLTAVLVIMFLQSRRRWMLLPVIVAAVILGVTFAPPAWQERMNFTSPDVVDASALSRLHAWAFARALAFDHPITGGGFATFTPELYDRYSPNIVETIYGPHSIYFQVLGEHGFVGLAIYLTLVASCLWSLQQVRRRGKALGDRGLALYAQMFQLSILGFLVSGTFLGRAYFDYFFTVVACIVILEGLDRDQPARQAATAPLLPVARTPDTFAAGLPTPTAAKRTTSQ
jgi:probable O-glycosylation ligase (exosortase A-associated)